MLYKRILSVDHGTTSGYSLLTVTDDKKVKKEESGFVYFSKDSTCEDFYEDYKDIIERLKPDTLVLEKVNVYGKSFGGNNVIRLAEIRSMLKLLANQNGLIIDEVNPTSVKKFMTGHGNASKLQVASAVCKKFNMRTLDIPKIRTKNPQFDVCDSLGNGLFAICRKINNGNMIEVL